MDEILTRETTVGVQVVMLYSFDGVRWDSERERLEEWHREQQRKGLSGAWHYERAAGESAARGRRRSARNKKRNGARKREDGHGEQSPDELDIDGELTALGGFRSLRQRISVEEDA